MKTTQKKENNADELSSRYFKIISDYIGPQKKNLNYQEYLKKQLSK